jgi:hypothetical protein
MFMRYWGYLLAKLLAGLVLAGTVWYAIRALFPRTGPVFFSQPDPFAHDLGYTTVMMVFFLCCTGLLYLIVWDQRYRCRTCLRRLRMPIFAGSWTNSLLSGQPRTEYICLYGHGTLKVPEIQITGPESAAWQAHDGDIWKELESVEESKR